MKNQLAEFSANKNPEIFSTNAQLADQDIRIT
ncbi:hypothetical protein IWX76_001196 [Pedobacter sp. CAN_A7]